MDLWICGSRGHLQDILLVLHMVDLLKADDVVEAENLDFFFGQLLLFIHYYHFLDNYYLFLIVWESQLLLFIEAT